jgi:hypothetical protein
MYAEGQLPRQSYLDGRSHPKDPNPAWLGHSIGRSEGDTLVVDGVGFNDTRTRPRMHHGCKTAKDVFSGRLYHYEKFCIDCETVCLSTRMDEHWTSQCENSGKAVAVRICSQSE